MRAAAAKQAPNRTAVLSVPVPLCRVARQSLGIDTRAAACLNALEAFSICFARSAEITDPAMETRREVTPPLALQGYPREPSLSHEHQLRAMLYLS